MVGRLASSDKAVLEARNKSWAEVEFIEPLPAATKRGGAYGGLVATLKAP